MCALSAVCAISLRIGVAKGQSRGFQPSDFAPKMGFALYQGTTSVVPPEPRRSNGLGVRVRVKTPEFGKPEGRTADPSTTLRSGRDHKFVWER
jgi:hypothetical protein